MISRTNKNAAISVITGLAFVAFAGQCITYQDGLRQKLGRATSAQQIYLGDRDGTIGTPERIRTSDFCLRRHLLCDESQ